MRLIATLAALALSAPSWSAQCSGSDTAAVMEKINKYIFPSPDSPKFRRMAWTTGNSDLERVMHEYVGLRVFISCDGRISKADELNGIQLRGEINFKYDAARYMDFPEITAEGVRWDRWSDWVEERETWNPGVIFRKYKGTIQLQREFVGPSYSDPLSAAYVDDFVKKAEAKAAELRAEEAERKRLEAEQAERAEQMAKLWQVLATRIKYQPNPNDYSLPYQYSGQHKVQVRLCVNPAGRVNVQVTETSGIPQVDRAAENYWSDYRFARAPNPKTAENICVERGIVFGSAD